MEKKIMGFKFFLLVAAGLFMVSCGQAPQVTEERTTFHFNIETEFITENGMHILPEMPFPYDALEPHMDAKTMEIHHIRHHGAQVNNFNNAIRGTEMEDMTMEDILQSVSKFPASVRNNGGGHWNHNLFWKILSPDGGGQPGGMLLTSIESKFGSFEAFKEEFHKAAMGQFGSGWAWLSVDENGELFVSSTPNQDNPLMDVADQRGIPILGLDVWEHAYYLLFQWRRAEFINAFWNVVNWPEVERRYELANAQ